MTKTPKPAAAKTARRQKLAQALRANLKRRKADRKAGRKASHKTPITKTGDADG